MPETRTEKEYDCCLRRPVEALMKNRTEETESLAGRWGGALGLNLREKRKRNKRENNASLSNKTGASSK